MARYIPRFESIGFLYLHSKFGDNVYLTSPGTQKELRKWIVRVCLEKPRHFLLNAKVGISRRYRQCLQQH
jgi:ABC-type ATPase with predicted acetyltransferase domain